MKKKVRIYKAEDGKGKFVNKTSKFLAKAQEGGMPDMSRLTYPGSQPTSQEDQTSQLIQLVVSDITSNVPREKTLTKLSNVMGIPFDKATELYMAIAEQITQQIEQQDNQDYEEETGSPREKEEALPVDAVITQEPEQDYDYDLNDDTGAEIAMADSGEPDVLDEALDPLEGMYQYGGMTGDEYTFAYPEVDNEQYNNQVSQMAWPGSDESSEENPYASDYYGDAILENTGYAKGGSYKKSKAKYVSSVMKLLKKQMGGDSEDIPNPNNGDPTGTNFRENRLKSFTSSVKNTAQQQALKEQLEQQYDQMMQEGGQSGDFENPMHHLNLYSQATRGIFNNPMNQMVQARRGMNVDPDLPVQNQDLLNLPRGFSRRTVRRFGNIPNLREVDVRRSGLFGPKEYTMYFEPSPLQQISNPLSAEIYGYGANQSAARKQTRTFEATKTYTNLLEDKAEKEAEKEVKEQVSEEQKAVEAATQQGSTAQGSTAQGSNKRTPVSTQSYAAEIQRDKWGRPEGDKWYNFNPDTKQFEGESLPFQRVEGSDFLYGRTPEGQWAYLNPAAAAYYPVSEGSPNMKALKAGQSKSASFVTLDSKPGYYYRVRNDGAYVKFQGDPLTHTASTKPLEVITSGDKRHAYIKKNAKASSNVLPAVMFGQPSASPSSNSLDIYNQMVNKMYGQHPALKQLITQQYGGNIENPFANPMEPLQKFIGGGYDPTEAQIDYSDSIDTSDAYFQRGGNFIKNFVPANLTDGNRQAVVQKIYNPVTGETRQQFVPGPGNQLAAIDVRKTGLTGRPKKYTVYYGAAGDPRYSNLITMDGAKGESGKKASGNKTTSSKSERQQALENAGYGDRTDVTGLKGKSKRAIRQGERQRDRDLKKLYKEDPTNVEFEKTNINAPYDYQIEQPMQIRSAQDELNKLIKQGPEQLVTQKQIDDLRSQVNMDWFPQKDKELDDYFMDLFNNHKEYRDLAIENNFKDPDGKTTDQERNIERASTLIPNYDLDWVFSNTKSDDINKLYDLNVDPNNLLDPRLQVEGIDANRRVEDWYRKPKEVSDDPMLQDNGDDAAWGLPTSPEEREAAAAAALQDNVAYELPQGDYNEDSGWGEVGARSFQDYVPGIGPAADETDQFPSFEEQYLQEGYQPAYSQDMLDRASGLRMAQPEQPMTDMGAWSGMGSSADIVSPGVNPFELPTMIDPGGIPRYLNDYYSPFEQPTRSARPTAPTAPTLNQLRAQQQSRPNANKQYTYNVDTSGATKDSDYIAAMQRARQDGVVTNAEANAALRGYKQKIAEKEKIKVASQAQRTIDQIMNSSSSKSEKIAARDKVLAQLQQRFEIIDNSVGSRKYGGALSRFVDGGNNQPFTGENPVAYTNNPMMQGKSDLDLITLNQGIQGAQGSVNWGSMASNPANATYTGAQPEQYKIDPNQREEYQVAKTYSEPMAVDIKVPMSQAQREASLITGNALMRGVTGIKNRRTDAQQMEGFYDNFSADNLYASDPSRDRGDYAESGLYRPDEQGQVWNSRSAQYGGYIDDDFEDGEEVYMTDEEIKEYMANGGQIEFI